MKITDGPDFASSSLPRHLLRGAVGIGSLVGAFALLPLYGPITLALAPLGLVALRGCPMCWAIGLAQTLSRGRLQRECTDGRCELKPAGSTPAGTTPAPPAFEARGPGRSPALSAPPGGTSQR